MSINIYKTAQNIPEMIPLGIAMDYQVNWNMHRIIRDFIQNFYDSIGCKQFADEFQYEWKVEENTLHIVMRTKGHSFSYEWLACLGGSTKTGKTGYAGEYGEGFKIAVLCLMKLGGNFLSPECTAGRKDRRGGWLCAVCQIRYEDPLCGKRRYTRDILL